MQFAPYASDPTLSRGRRFLTDASPTRNGFQRDRDRILHSTAFRRLQHKTQVFLHHEGRHFRTRLTHTLEVSQISRSLARALNLNEDLAEAVALAHDLGHPPFGHAGERVLDQRMLAFGGFDHNIQALRVVTQLENHYAEHDGLNLTWESHEGILKHNGPLIPESGATDAARKPLPFGAERLSRELDLPLSGFASLEAQIAAISDDIAYNSHDVDDAVRAGLLSLEQMREVPLVGPICEEVLTRWPHIEVSRQTHEVQRRLITRMVEDAISATGRNLERLKPCTADQVRNAGNAIAGFSPEMETSMSALKRYLFEHVYRSEHVMAPVRRGQKVVGQLFDSMLADPGKLPSRWRLRLDEASGEAEKARIVCDFVAGMTDPFAIEMHAGLFDAAPDFG